MNQWRGRECKKKGEEVYEEGIKCMYFTRNSLNSILEKRMCYL